MPADLVRTFLFPNGVADPRVTALESAIRRVTPDQFPDCYALLEETFRADELNTRQQMLAELAEPATAGRADEFVVLARLPSAEHQPGPAKAAISLIVGCYLGLGTQQFAGQSVGFIEYLVTNAAFRQQGHANAMLTAFEQEMRRIAAFRQEQLRLILGEIDMDLVAYKRKRGYRQPLASRYVQPPIAFDAHTGWPLSPALPKVLVVNSWNLPIEEAVLLHTVQQIFEKRYLPRHLGEVATQTAAAYINEYVYAPFAASLQASEGIVRLS